MDFQMAFVMCLVPLVFAGFVWGRIPPDVVALSAVALLLGAGILDVSEFLAVFSNSAPMTIAMMFIISAALERTGCLGSLGRLIRRMAGQSIILTLLITMFAVMIASAFMNNTPVVIVLTPVLIALARSLGVAPSKMLIPLSFAAIFGGMTTLVGTSTNILVSGVARDFSLPPIGMFEMTIPALVLISAGMIYMMLIGRFLLPNRNSLAGILADQPKRQFIAELLIPLESSLIGKTLSEAKFESEDTKLVDVVRFGRSLRGDLSEITLQAGDHVVLETNAGEMIGLKENGDVTFKNVSEGLEPLSADETVIMEGSLHENSPLIGRLVGNLQLRRRYGIYILAVHRNDEDINKNFNKIRLRFGDTLLLEGPAEGISQLLADNLLVNLSKPEERPLRKNKAPLALLTIAAVMGFAAFDILPIAATAIIGAVFVMLSGCVDPDEAYKSIDWRILFLIFAMLGLSVAMQKTGAADFVVGHLVNLVASFGPVAVLAIIYLTTSALTEMISNNAVAVLMAPIVITLAEQLGLDSRPFLIAVMFAASASFTTPIGYQTNTFVYSAGGYKFRDFIKVGLPLNLMFAALATYIIPKFFPF